MAPWRDRIGDTSRPCDLSYFCLGAFLSLEMWRCVRTFLSEDASSMNARFSLLSLSFHRERLWANDSRRWPPIFHFARCLHLVFAVLIRLDIDSLSACCTRQHSSASPPKTHSADGPVQTTFLHSFSCLKVSTYLSLETKGVKESIERLPVPLPANNPLFRHLNTLIYVCVVGPFLLRPCRPLREKRERNIMQKAMKVDTRMFIMREKSQRCGFVHVFFDAGWPRFLPFFSSSVFSSSTVVLSISTWTDALHTAPFFSIELCSFSVASMHGSLQCFSLLSSLDFRSTLSAQCQPCRKEVLFFDLLERV